MNPFVAALLFLLRQKHASGNHPDGEAQAHIDAIEAAVAEHRISEDEPEPDPALPVGEPEIRIFVRYPCGCSAGPGPADLPKYCPEHGTHEDTSGAVVERVQTAILEQATPAAQ